jgi:hypothetical protein
MRPGAFYDADNGDCSGGNEPCIRCGVELRDYELSGAICDACLDAYASKAMLDEVTSAENPR